MPIWGPILLGMVGELVAKVDPAFGMIVTPPCLKGDEFTGCVYEEENKRRYDGRDAHPPCSLHYWQRYSTQNPGAPKAPLPEDVLQRASTEDIPMRNEMMARSVDYRLFWGRDPFTGRRLPVVQ